MEYEVLYKNDKIIDYFTYTIDLHHTNTKGGTSEHEPDTKLADSGQGFQLA